MALHDRLTQLQALQDALLHVGDGGALIREEGPQVLLQHCDLQRRHFLPLGGGHGLHDLLRGQTARLALLLQLLGLGAGGDFSLLLNSVRQHLLLLGLHLGNIRAGVDRDLPLVHQVLEFRDQFIQSLVPLDGGGALAHLLGQLLVGVHALDPQGLVLRDLLLGPAAHLPFHGVGFHLIGAGLLHRADLLPLEVGVHHGNDGLVPVQIADDNRNIFNPGQLAGAHTAVAGDHLIAAVLMGDDHDRLQHAEFLDAVHQVPHILVVADCEGVPFKGPDIRHLHGRDRLRLALLGQGDFQVFGQFFIPHGGGFRGLIRLGGLLRGIRDQLAGDRHERLIPVPLTVLTGLGKGHFIHIRPDLQHPRLLQRLAAVEAVYQLKFVLFLALAENDGLLQAVFLNVRDQAAVILAGFVLDIGAGQRFDFGEGNETQVGGSWLLLLFVLGLTGIRHRRLLPVGRLGRGVRGSLGLLLSLLLVGRLGGGVCGGLGGFLPLLPVGRLGGGVRRGLGGLRPLLLVGRLGEGVCGSLGGLRLLLPIGRLGGGVR